MKSLTAIALLAVASLTLCGCEGLSNPGAWDRAMQLQRFGNQAGDGIDHYYAPSHYTHGKTREQLMQEQFANSRPSADSSDEN